MSKYAVIIGAGPAGLTAGYELLKNTDIKPVVFELFIKQQKPITFLKVGYLITFNFIRNANTFTPNRENSADWKNSVTMMDF